jgi:hypothetical protein
MLDLGLALKSIERAALWERSRRPFAEVVDPPIGAEVEAVSGC